MIGSENLLTEGTTIKDAQTASLSTQQQILAILRPGDSEEIQECLKIAQYPYSVILAKPF